MRIADSTATVIRDSRPVNLPPSDACWAIRRSFQLTQDRVGDIVGVTGQTVSFWETGRYEPTGQRRLRYVELLRACVDEASQ
jgi:DNA-binding XRE family transcriptional regulator